MKKICCLLLSFVMAFTWILTVSAADDFANSAAYSVGTAVNGSITSGNESDMYTFELPSSGKLSIALSAKVRYLNVKIFDQDKRQIWKSNPYWDPATEVITLNESVFLNKGTYYFGVSKHEGEGEYSFTISFEGVNESFSEVQGGTNNKATTANTIEMNQKYVGFIGANDNVDTYRINITAENPTFNLKASIYSVQLKILDEKGKEKWDLRPTWNNSTKEMDLSRELKLPAGVYTLSVAEISGHGEFTFWFTDGSYVSEQQSTETVITVMLDGKRLPFDQHPIIENGRTLVPLRVIFEALGAYVKWDPDTQTITATKGIKTVILQIGSAQMTVNDTVKVLDVPAKLLNGRTLVPVRAVSEAFGCNVDWDETTKTVILKS